MPFKISGSVFFKEIEVRFWENKYCENSIEKTARLIFDKYNFNHTNPSFSSYRRFQDKKDDDDYQRIRAFFTAK